MSSSRRPHRRRPSPPPHSFSESSQSSESRRSERGAARHSQQSSLDAAYARRLGREEYAGDLPIARREGFARSKELIPAAPTEMNHRLLPARPRPSQRDSSIDRRYAVRAISVVVNAARTTVRITHSVYTYSVHFCPTADAEKVATQNERPSQDARDQRRKIIFGLLRQRLREDFGNYEFDNTRLFSARRVDRAKTYRYSVDGDCDDIPREESLDGDRAVRVAPVISRRSVVSATSIDEMACFPLLRQFATFVQSPGPKQAPWVCRQSSKRKSPQLCTAQSCESWVSQKRMGGDSSSPEIPRLRGL